MRQQGRREGRVWSVAGARRVHRLHPIVVGGVGGQTAQDRADRGRAGARGRGRSGHDRRAVAGRCTVLYGICRVRVVRVHRARHRRGGGTHARLRSRRHRGGDRRGGEGLVRSVACTRHIHGLHLVVVRRVRRQAAQGRADRGRADARRGRRTCNHCRTIAGRQAVAYGIRRVRVVRIHRTRDRGSRARDAGSGSRRRRGNDRGGGEGRVVAVAGAGRIHGLHLVVVRRVRRQAAQDRADRSRAGARGGGRSGHDRRAVAGRRAVPNGIRRVRVVRVHRAGNRRAGGAYVIFCPCCDSRSRAARRERQIAAVGRASAVYADHAIVVGRARRQSAQGDAHGRSQRTGHRALPRGDGRAVAGRGAILERHRGADAIGVHRPVQSDRRRTHTRRRVRRCRGWACKGGEGRVETVHGARRIRGFHPVVVGARCDQTAQGRADGGRARTRCGGWTGHHRRAVARRQAVLDRIRRGRVVRVHRTGNRRSGGTHAGFRPCRGSRSNVCLPHDVVDVRVEIGTIEDHHRIDVGPIENLCRAVESIDGRIGIDLNSIPERFQGIGRIPSVVRIPKEDLLQAENRAIGSREGKPCGVHAVPVSLDGTGTTASQRIGLVVIDTGSVAAVVLEIPESDPIAACIAVR